MQNGKWSKVCCIRVNGQLRRVHNSCVTMTTKIIPSPFHHQVCRKFKFFCEEVKIDEIIICNKGGNRKAYWFHTNKQFNYKDSLHINLWVNEFEIYRPIFQLEKSLKRLYFRGCITQFDKLNISCFSQLVQLQMELDTIYYGNRRVVIELPNLKILEIGEGFSETSELHLNTPKLEMLKCHKFESIHLVHPNTIHHLELAFYAEAALQLVNVSYLKVDWKQIRHRNILSMFPKLQTLICDACDHEDEEDFDATTHELRQLVMLKKPEQKIYYLSVELNAEKIDEYEDSRNALAFQISNYNSLCANIFYSAAIDYNELMGLVNGSLPDDFFQKFLNIRSVVVSGKSTCQQHLSSFLKRLEYLNSLRLTDTFLDQTFYDGLHEMSQLRKIYVKNSPIRNHDFLFKLPILEDFITDEDNAYLLDVASALYCRLKFLSNFNFYVNGEFIMIYWIWHAGMYVFRRFITNGNGCKELKTIGNNMTFEEMVDVIKSFKSYLLWVE